MRAAPRRASSWAGMTRVSLATSTSPGRSRRGQVGDDAVLQRRRRPRSSRAESRGRAGLCAIRSGGSAKSKSARFTPASGATRRSQRISGTLNSTAQALPTTWPGRKSRLPKASERNTTLSTTRPDAGRRARLPAPAGAAAAACRRRNRRLAEQERERRRRAPARAARSGRRAPSPATIAATPQPAPRQRCTTSRSTSAAPAASTPDGASSPGATGTRQARRRADRADVADQPVRERDAEQEQDEGGDAELRVVISVR